MASSDMWPADWAAATNNALESSLLFWSSMPFKYVFIGHALFCTSSGSEFKDRWLVHLLLTFLWGNGGGIITTALMMQPKVATFSFFQTDFITGGWIVCWWLMNWCPGGLPAKLLSKWYFKMVIKACTMLLRAQLIINRVDLGVRLFPGVVSAPIILGTIAGCGGRLLADGIMTGWQSMPGLAELTSPGFVSRSAAAAAVAYYTLAYATQLLPIQAAAGLVETALMLHAFASDLSGQALDFTSPATHLLHTLTCVPPPPSQPQVAPETVLLKRVALKAVRSPAANTPSSRSPAKTPSKSPAKPNSASKQGHAAYAGAAAVAQAAASPLPNGTARKRRGKAAAAEEYGEAAEPFDSTTAAAAAEDVCVVEEQQQQQRGQAQKARRSSTAPEVAAGVTTRRRAAAAATYA